MQLIFLLIVLFVLGCLLYGIYAGVSAIGRIGARMGEQEQKPIPCPLLKNLREHGHELLRHACGAQEPSATFARAYRQD